MSKHISYCRIMADVSEGCGVGNSNCCVIQISYRRRQQNMTWAQWTSNISTYMGWFHLHLHSDPK